MLKCEMCGHQGIDVIRVFNYIGGVGEVASIQCTDRVACWKRWDDQTPRTDNPNYEHARETLRTTLNHSFESHYEPHGAPY